MKKYMQTSPPPNVLSRLQSVNLMVAKVNVCRLLCNFFPLFDFICFFAAVNFLHLLCHRHLGNQHNPLMTFCLLFKIRSYMIFFFCINGNFSSDYEY